MTVVVRVALLTAIWSMLWSDWSVANVVSGLLVSLAVVTVFRSGRRGTVTVRPLRATKLLVVFAVELVKSTFTVARAVIAPRHRVHAGIIAVPLRGCSDAIATLIADLISLTPGTLTVEVSRDPLVLYVHALDTRDIDSLRAGIHRFELLAVQAFGDREAIAAITAAEHTVWRAR